MYNKKDSSTIAFRLTNDERLRLERKHPKRGELSKVLRVLITKYLEGRIIGVKLPT